MDRVTQFQTILQTINEILSEEDIIKVKSSSASLLHVLSTSMELPALSQEDSFLQFLSLCFSLFGGEEEFLQICTDLLLQIQAPPEKLAKYEFWRVAKLLPRDGRYKAVEQIIKETFRKKKRVSWQDTSNETRYYEKVKEKFDEPRLTDKEQLVELDRYKKHEHGRFYEPMQIKTFFVTREGAAQKVRETSSFPIQVKDPRTNFVPSEIFREMEMGPGCVDLPILKMKFQGGKSWDGLKKLGIWKNVNVGKVLTDPLILEKMGI